uniref:UBIQUITIN_CONJUGAT_2 domain-containing protein n=2 Tax=Steinernema glaseri TaxID=37863 RepID=A0A1I8AGB2_9BILA
MGESSTAMKALAKELKDCKDSPIEGFTVDASEDNLFHWNVGIYGPPCTIYQGGYFKASITFPSNYPFAPPSVRFLTQLFHPNVYENGDLCISILHPPIDDPMSGELPCERWNPTQNVRTVLLSVIALLNEPNISSPANVDASVSYRKWKAGECSDYETTVKKQVEESKKEAEKEGIYVPTTVEEYCIKQAVVPMDDEDFDFDYDDVESDGEEETEGEDEEDDDDSD